MSTFETLGLSQRALTVLDRKGFNEPTPIQQRTIPAILEGQQDMIGQAATGTGKTAAFGLPIFEQLDEGRREVQALVLTPTRELAVQVARELESLRGGRQLSIMAIYGGRDFAPQLRALRQGLSVVVGTPGRILDHIRRGRLRLEKLKFMVLDEADEMLNLGFQEDVEAILEATSADKRTFLFSATMPSEIQAIAEKYMKEYELIRATSTPETASLTEHTYHEVHERDRFEALCRIIDAEDDLYGIVFCRTRLDTSELADRLSQRGYQMGALHGDFTQTQREMILQRFRRRQIRILVATDVAARGIDVKDLTHVINYHLPQSPDHYIHRIGRTGRAGRRGKAVTLINPSEHRKLQYIQRGVQTTIRKEKLLTVEQLIERKTGRIRARVAEAAEAEVGVDQLALARELLAEGEGERIVAALLQQMFPNELDRSSHSEISEVRPQPRRPSTRLHVARGRRDGVTPKRLLRLLRDNCRVSSQEIRDLEIRDRCAYVTLPARDAKVLLAQFRSKQGKPLITRAGNPGAKKGRPSRRPRC